MSKAFAYLVADRSGRRMRGEIAATDAERAIDQLRQRGDTVIEITPLDSAQKSLRLEIRTRLTDADLAEFALELRALILSGSPLPKALATLAESAGSRQAASLARDLRLQLELGNNASAALANAPTSGSRLLGRFLAASESGGRHEAMLGIAATFLARRYAAVQRIRSALAYPIFLLVASAAAIGFLVINVAPTLADLFDEGKAPSFIAVGSAIGVWVQDNARLCLLLAGLLVALGFFVLRREGARTAFGAFLLWAPPIRRIAAGLTYGPALMAYAALTRTGWPAERALRLTADLADGRARRTFASVAQRLRDGATLSDAFREETAMPREVVHAIEIGEATGTAADNLDRVSEHLVTRSLRALDRLAAVIGPLLVAAIGGVVAMIMLALLSNIGSLGDAVG